MISFKQLAVFDAVARLGGVAAASRGLRMSQASVSETVSELEARLGQPLFERGRGRLRPNGAGLALMPRASALLREVEAIERDHGERRALLRIGTSVTVGETFLPTLLAAVHRHRPEIDFSVLVRNSQAVADALEGEQVAAAVVEDQVERPGLATRRWRRDELIVVCAGGHHLAGRSATSAELAEETWALRELGSGTRATFDAATLGWFTPGRIAMTAGGNELLRKTVAGGAALSCLSRAAVAEDLERGALAQVEVPWPPMVRILRVLTPLRARPDPAVAALLRSCGESADPDFRTDDWQDASNF